MKAHSWGPPTGNRPPCLGAGFDWRAPACILAVAEESAMTENAPLCLLTILAGVATRSDCQEPPKRPAEKRTVEVRVGILHHGTLARAATAR